MLTRPLLTWALAGVAVRTLGVCGFLLDCATRTQITQNGDWHSHDAGPSDLRDHEDKCSDPSDHQNGGAGPLGSGHSPGASGLRVADCGGSVEEPSTHLIHGPASPTDRENGDEDRG